MTSGYFGTPLAKKLGIKEGHSVSVIDEYATFRDDLAPTPAGVDFSTEIATGADIVLIFVVEGERLEALIEKAEQAVYPNGALWISWPKRASKVPTDMTEDVVREVALPRGLVDNKVCAVNETWSALRLVWRKALR